MSEPSSNPPTDERRRFPRPAKQDAEIVLVCNPRAGGRWKELASILDSEEAQYVRRVVTDSVEDISAALTDLGRDAKLLCVYGGDGTVQKVLDRVQLGKQDFVLGLLGGGTMNVTSRWCGFSRNPGRNFRYLVRAFRSGDLLSRDLPIMRIANGSNVHHGFTFGMGPIVRLLDSYERGRKGKVAAIGVAMGAMAATWTRRPARYEPLLAEMTAEISLDDEPLPYQNYSALFANVTGQINPGIEPFTGNRARESFHCAAYAVGARELTLVLPFLARGWLPRDLDFSRLLKRTGKMPTLPSDARYVNRPASRLTVTATSEEMYTVDGEILPMSDGTIRVTVGPMLRLATGPLLGLRMARQAVKAGG